MIIIMIGYLLTVIITVLIFMTLMGMFYRAKVRYCPKHWRVDGKTIIVTGGNSGTCLIYLQFLLEEISIYTFSEYFSLRKKLLINTILEIKLAPTAAFC